ncbi:MAG TPA: hypothetical protein VFT99_13500, partial [Roseiflexaceae bacterium]|nr:hypothetical protein [Roseiflexaceae bacterium]
MKHVLALLLLVAVLVSATFTRAMPRAGTPPPLTRFDVVVSLEWEPGKQAASGATLPELLAAAGCPAEARGNYLDDLEAGFAEASNYIYAYSQGRFALGTITIDTTGDLWQKADVRILADASYRPTATVGGVVASTIRYTATPTGLEVIFDPGAVTLGRYWNGLGARCGAWS